VKLARRFRELAGFTQGEIDVISGLSEEAAREATVASAAARADAGAPA
jgi:hypothetical protein